MFVVYWHHLLPCVRLPEASVPPSALGWHYRASRRQTYSPEPLESGAAAALFTHVFGFWVRFAASQVSALSAFL